MKVVSIILSIFTTLLFSNANAGIFGPSTYEECVIAGLKDAKTDTAVALLHRVCLDKFDSKGTKSVVRQCFATLNGNKFTPGKPSNANDYTGIAFKGTSDIVYVPNKMFPEITQEFVRAHKDSIQKTCPGINFNIQ